jgi:hypothetical protein
MYLNIKNQKLPPLNDEAILIHLKIYVTLGRMGD